MNDEYVADIEPVAGILRVFKRGMVPGVDEYEFAATVVYSEDGKTAELMGVTSRDGSFVAVRQAVFKALWIRGVSTLIWNRRKDGKKRLVRIDLVSYFNRH
jgi:hypothetical protein